jgi:uncharacterized repeat protein (TIGR01451 family)
LVIVLSIGFLAAWQNPPPLSLTARVEPGVAAGGETITFYFTVTNTGQAALDDLEVSVTVPQGTTFDRAVADNQQWDMDMAGRTVRYQATGSFPAQASAELVLEVVVREDAGQTIVLDAYEATARSFGVVAGASLTVPIEEAAAPAATQTATVTVTPTATATPLPTQTPEPTLTPTITVVVAELPPTPTPNLSSEQEVVGTVTVLIFVSLVVAVIIAVVVWIVKNAKND